MTPQEWLLAAAKRTKVLMAARISGGYFGPSEELQALRELTAAIEAVEQARTQDELVSRR